MTYMTNPNPNPILKNDVLKILRCFLYHFTFFKKNKISYILRYLFCLLICIRIHPDFIRMYLFDILDAVMPEIEVRCQRVF